MRLSGDGWGIELWIASYVPLRSILGYGNIISVKNLITNFGLKALNYKYMNACMIR